MYSRSDAMVPAVKFSVVYDNILVAPDDKLKVPPVLIVIVVADSVPPVRLTVPVPPLVLTVMPPPLKTDVPLVWLKIPMPVLEFPIFANKLLVKLPPLRL